MRELPREERGRSTLTRHSYSERSYCSYTLSQPRGTSPTTAVRLLNKPVPETTQYYYSSFSALTPPRRSNCRNKENYTARTLDSQNTFNNNGTNISMAKSESQVDDRNNHKEEELNHFQDRLESQQSLKSTPLFVDVNLLEKSEEDLQGRRTNYLLSKPTKSGKPVTKHTIEKVYTHTLSASQTQLINEQLYSNYSSDQSLITNDELMVNDPQIIDKALETRRLQRHLKSEPTSPSPSTPTNDHDELIQLEKLISSPKLKKSLSSGISNFFRKMSPKTFRKKMEKHSKYSLDTDPESSTSAGNSVVSNPTSSPSKKPKELSSFRRFFSPTRKRREREECIENKSIMATPPPETSRILKSIGQNAANLNGGGVYSAFKEKRGGSNDNLTSSSRPVAIKAVGVLENSVHVENLSNGEAKKNILLENKKLIEEDLFGGISNGSIGQCSLNDSDSDLKEKCVLENNIKRNVHKQKLPIDNGTTYEMNEKDGNYFRLVMEKSNKRFSDLIELAEHDLSSQTITEEIKEKLRLAIGKARLLTTKKFHQFDDLCTKNLTNNINSKFPTTNQDLAGFWDLISIQINEINSLFDEIEKLRKNNWDITDSNLLSPNSDISVKQPNSAPTPRRKKILQKERDTNSTKSDRKQSVDSARDIERRRQLLEAKRAMKERNVKKQTEGEITIEFS